MKKAYLGVDIGSISTKGVIIDDNDNVIAYFDEEGLTTYNTTIQALKNGIEYKKNLQVNGIYFSDKQSV